MCRSWRYDYNPDEYFTNLPLAATYHETGRYADALPLFKHGFTQLKILKPTSILSNRYFLRQTVWRRMRSPKNYGKVTETCTRRA